MSSRVEYLDLAKGFAIIIVLLYHLFGMHFFLSNLLQPVMLPVFYIVSGMFYKKYGGVREFLVKKTNSLLVPFCFWYFVVSAIIPYIVHISTGYRICEYHSNSLIESIGTIFCGESTSNGTVWYLLSIFWICILFYVIRHVSCRLFPQNDVLLTGIFCFGFGGVGLCLGYERITIPGFVDCAFTALPFFYAGYVLNNKTDIVRSEFRTNRMKLFSIVLLGVFVLLLFGGEISFVQNLVTGENWYSIHMVGIWGGFALLVISKFIVRLPVVSYFGRNSLVILCTNSFYIKLIYDVLGFFNVHVGGKVHMLIAVTVFLSYFLIIPLCNKYLPYFVGRKSLLH